MKTQRCIHFKIPPAVRTRSAWDALRKTMTSVLPGDQNIKGRLRLSQLGKSLIFLWLLPFIDLWLNILWGYVLFLWHSERGTDLFGRLDEPVLTTAHQGDTLLRPTKQNSKLSFVFPDVLVLILFY